MLRFVISLQLRVNRNLLQTKHSTQYSSLLYSSNGVYATNRKIGVLSRAGNIQAARQLFDKMPDKDVVSWNAIITSYWKNGNLEESKKLFDSMPARNVVSWNSMIAAHIHHGNIDKAFRYFEVMPCRNTASYNAMISGCVKNEEFFPRAIRLFEEMPKKNVISYTAMIDGYMKKGEVDKAMALFDSMPLKNDVSWTVMISGYVEKAKFYEANELYEKMPDKNATVMTAMITGYFKEGRTQDARLLFNKIPCKDSVAWNAMIEGFAQNGDGEEALKLYKQMLKIGMQQDQSTFLSVFTACSSLASLKEGKQTHAHVIKNGFESNIPVCNSLVTMYSKCGSILDSEIAFGWIHSPTTISWNTIIAAFAQHGLYEKAFTFFKSMCSKAYQPDSLTFLSLLSASGHAGKVTESIHLFDMMIENYGIDPNPEHYACLIDTLSRAGQLEKAYKIIEHMPIKADVGIWGSLLTACGTYLNLELGEIVAKKILDLDHSQSGAYIALSNIYAAAGLWKEVTRVRLMMKEYGIKKQRACSWIEIGNDVHAFLSGDLSHPSIDLIHTELKRICLQMKAKVDIAENFEFSAEQLVD
ncbi:hypothetical protein ACFE04_016755 [Oxalis oulophora]